jgi:hypothetical protein
LGGEYPSYPCRQKVQILLFKSKWDTLSVLNIENEKYFVSKIRGAAPLRGGLFKFLLIGVSRDENLGFFFIIAYTELLSQHIIAHLTKY